MDIHNIINNMDRFKNNIISKYKEQGKAWLEKLPKIVTELAIEWKFNGT